MTKTAVRLRLNGSDVAGFADDGENLLDFLRRRLGDLSPKYGCGQGTCGTCTVMIDGELRLSCLTFAEAADGREVRTTSGLNRGGKLSPLQTSFIDGFAAQCGFCTPGMLMAATALLERKPDPSRAEVEEAISGNICRCTGYEPIIEAILTAAGAMRRAGH